MGAAPSIAVSPAAPLWRNRDYMLLWTGQLVSSLGSGISGIAFPLLILALTGSPAEAGFAGGLAGLPYVLFSLPAGALVDRWNRKRVMILCDTCRALSLASVPLAAAFWHLTVTQLFVNATIEGTLFTFFNIAEVAALPRVVSKEQLPSASAQNEASQFATGLVSPPLGGFIFGTLGHTVPFLFDAISYSASVISLLFVRTTFQTERAPRVSSIRAEILEGLRWLWGHSLIRTIAFVTAGLNFAGNATFLIIIIIARNQGAPAYAIGGMVALASIGGLVGSLVAPRIQRRFSFGHVIVASVVVQALLFPLFIVAPNPFVLGAVFGLLAPANPIYNAVQLGYRLSVIPDALQGRVNSAIRLIAWGVIPLGVSLSGVLIEWIGARPTVAAFACWMAILALVVALHPGIRRARPGTSVDAA